MKRLHLPPVPFVDLDAQRRRLESRLDQAMQRVLAHGRFVLGPEVDELERRLKLFSGARNCITCANGTDALILSLLARSIGPGDAVLVPDFTFVATAEAVVRVGATPVLVDVRPDTFCIDPVSIEAGIEEARRSGLRSRAVIAVDLYGQPADYRAIVPIAEKHGLLVIADAAQSFGASYFGQKVGTLAPITATSFYPSKPLGCYGDGGAVFTDDDDLAEHIRSLRCHGQSGSDRDHDTIGLNSRLDTLQAAVLIEKLAIFEEEIEARNSAACNYTKHLDGLVRCPEVAAGSTSVWAQYTLVVQNRRMFIETCTASGVPTAVHYSRPLHDLTAYRNYPRACSKLPTSDLLARHVVSIPMHAYLDTATQMRVIEAASQAAGTSKRRKRHAFVPQSAILD